MALPAEPSRLIRFGAFELDAVNGELHKAGVSLKMHPQPLRVLLLLVEHAGEAVTREEIQHYIWRDNTFVDFERGINFCINQIRTALGDEAEKPRYVETLPRRGYRFIATVTMDAALASPALEFLDSIAVLPFENTGGEQEMEYLSDGITTGIINNLSQLRKLRVVPRTTAFRYKGKVSDAAQAGRELHVRLVLTGQVVHRGDGLVVNAELIDALHESQLWGANYNRKLEDILPVQAEIARQITSRLRLRLNDEERQQLAKPPTENREAYYLYLKAMYWANKWTPDGVRKGADYTRQAIDADPVYADAWNALAYLYVMMGFLGGEPIGTFAKAKAAAVKALELDDGQADAHSILAVVLFVHDWNWHGAHVELLRAMEIGPSLALGHYAYSHWYLTQKLYEDALREARLALDIDPLSVNFTYHIGLIHYSSGRYDEAIKQCHEANQLDPLFLAAHQLLALAYARKGLRHAAMTEVGMVLEHAKNDIRSEALHGTVDALTGKPLEARRALAKLRQELTPPDFSLAYRCAVLHALLGETDEAFECLDKALQGRAVALAYLAATPELDSLRGDPRFGDVLRSIGFPVSRI